MADKFDELIHKGELTKAARLFAKEYYENGMMGYTRKRLIDNIADRVDESKKEINKLEKENSELKEALKEIAHHIHNYTGAKENYEKTAYDFIDIAKRGLGY